MRSQHLLARATVAVAATASLLAASSAVGHATSAENAAAPCDAGWNCWWPQANYSGPVQTWDQPGAPDVCTVAGADEGIRSYAFYGGQEGYFYRTRDCTGDARAVLMNTESPDLGFTAYSFKSACVSCLASKE